MYSLKCALWILFAATALGQAPPIPCDAVNHPFAPCALIDRSQLSLRSGAEPASVTWILAEVTDKKKALVPESDSTSFVSPPKAQQKQGFHWGRALLESFELLSIEQAYVVHTDWNWVAGKNSENGVPFNHYWRDYKQSLSAWVHAGWNDGDPNMYGYLGHPIQGVAASYIYLQNDPKSERLEFSKTKAYWRSRLMATVWNAAYSTQWNIGPLSEATVEKYGTHQRSPWNHNGTWPCTTKNCYTGMGQIDLVMTPIGGLGWLVGEDILDRFVTRRVEASTRDRALIDVIRCGLDPIRVGTNLLHGKRPWYRPRDTKDVYDIESSQPQGIRTQPSEASRGH